MSVQFSSLKEKMAERAESEIRRYACCTDNLKAEIVFSIINIILNIVGIVLAIIYVVVPTAKLLDWNFVVSTYFENICQFLYLYFYLFSAVPTNGR